MKTAIAAPADDGSDDSINRFLEAMKRGYEGIKDAAEIAREAIAKDPEWPEKVAAKAPLFGALHIRRFADIGLKYIAELSFPSSPGANALRKLPVAIQEKLFGKSVAVLIQNGETLLIDISNLTKEQARQVFASDHVRDAAEQRAWIESEKLKTPKLTPLQDGQPYQIKNHKFRIAGYEFTVRQLQRIIDQMKKGG